MSETWVEIHAGARRERVVLASERMRFGGASCDVAIEGAGADELHFWTRPPKAIFIGERTTPLLNGRPFVESDLKDGDCIQWCGAALVFGTQGAQVLEELPQEPSPARAAAEPNGPNRKRGEPDALTQRVRAGLAAEQGLANKKEVKRWQQAVMRGEFDPDACARDLLRDVPADDPRLLQRAARLQRDLVMTSLQRGARGAARKARGAARNGLAMILSQGLAILVYSLILVVIFALLRGKNGTSVDEWLDTLIGIFKPG